MSWVVVIWSLAAGACLTLGVVHFLVWCWDRALRASLWFAGVAFAVAVLAGMECGVMRVQLPAEFLALHRLVHLTFFFPVVFIVGFVQSYFRTGRRWLAWTFVAVRALVVVLAFVPGPTFNFREVTAMVPYQFLGETLMAPKAVPTPWARLGESSGLLLLVFVGDAAIRLWRKGGVRERQRALVVGGGVVLFTLACMTNGFLVHTGRAQVPYFFSLSFMFIVVAIAFELSRDLMNAARMAEELRELRNELAHVTRVTTLSELSGSLAHELNQPLGIILSNAQAAQRLLAQSPPDVAEVRDILADIVSEDRRAGAVIERLRALLKRGESAVAPVDLHEAIEDVLHLARADLAGQGIAIVRGLANDLPKIKGDRVQLRQVVLNLLLNGADAMSANGPGTRRLHVTTAQRDGVVRVSVRDEGCGLPTETERVFAPFFTTKPKGLGLGLAICRTIIGAHGGRLWAEPHPDRGAVFHFELPVWQTPAG